MLELPPEFHRRTGHLLAAELSAWSNVFRVWLLTGERGRFVLKIGDNPTAAAELEAEARLLAQLSIYAPFVASPLARATVGDDAWFLFSYLDGRNLCEGVKEAATPRERTALVAEFGRTLRAVHAWKPNLPHPANWLAEAVAGSERNVATGRVPDPVEEPCFRTGARTADLLAELREGLPRLEPDIVFSHGDWCLPNAIVRDGRIIGAVDWSRGGYADRRWDLVTGVWTVLFTTGDRSLGTVFLDAYGYRKPASSLRWFEALWTVYV